MLFQNVPTKDYLLSQLLLDYQNQVDKNGKLIDVSKGTMTYIDCNAQASALQSLYYELKFIENQALPNLSETTELTLKKWASTYGLILISGETNAQLLVRVVNRIQYPPAGGNIQDWIGWATSQFYTRSNSNSSAFTERPFFVKIALDLRYSGSIDVVIASNMGKIDSDNNQIPRYDSGFTGYLINDFVYEVSTRKCREYLDDSLTYSYVFASSGLVNIVEIYCESKRPIGISNNLYHAAAFKTINFDITIPSSNSNFTEIQNAIIAMVDAKQIGENVYLNDIIGLLVSFGVNTQTITSPAADVTVSKLEKAFVGTCTVHN